MTHPNGSHLEGYVVKPEDRDDYAQYRDIGVYCPFPEGVWSSIRARDAEGVGIINEIGVIWARHIGVPCPFKQPVKVFIEKGYIKRIEGGEEAETLTRFYQFISKYLGESAYEVAAFMAECIRPRSLNRTSVRTRLTVTSSSITTGAVFISIWVTVCARKNFRT